MLNFELSIISSHAEGVAQVGDMVNFNPVLVVSGPYRKIYCGIIRYLIIRNGETVVQSGEISSGSTLGISFVPETYGWYHGIFEAHYCGELVASRSIGVLIEPDKIIPHLDVANDFDTFWNAQIKKQQKFQLQLELKEIEKNDALEVFDLEASGMDNMRLTGVFTRPTNAKEHGHPAILLPQGAGVRSSGVDPFATAMAIRNFITLDYNPFGIDNNRSPQWYSEQEKAIGNYPQEGFICGNPEKVYMKNVFLRTIRALECLKQMPEWDCKNLIVAGGSQGAWQAIAAAALDHEVTCLAVNIPAGCDLGGGGWPFAELIGKDIPGEFQKTFPYFDACSFASRIKNIPIQFTIGLIDTICKPDGIMAAYNQINVPIKELNLHYQMGHESSESTITGMQNFILKYLH